MQKAVCGFYFSEDHSQVVLIRKERPSWQKGLLNGVGGKVEPGESFDEAMRREFEEETGVVGVSWSSFCSFGDAAHGFEVLCFRAFGNVHACKTTTDEKLSLESVEKLGQDNPTIPNLLWLIPMALDPTVKLSRVLLT